MVSLTIPTSKVRSTVRSLLPKSTRYPIAVRWTSGRLAADRLHKGPAGGENSASYANAWWIFEALEKIGMVWLVFDG